MILDVIAFVIVISLCLAILIPIVWIGTKGIWKFFTDRSFRQGRAITNAEQFEMLCMIIMGVVYIVGVICLFTWSIVTVVEVLSNNPKVIK